MQEDTLKFYQYSPVKKPRYKGKFCYRPFTNMMVDEDGDVMLCGCQFHMPFVIGNIYQNSIKEIWNNHLAQQVRQSVIDEEFTYCSWSCSYLQTLPARPQVIAETPEFPTTIILSMDRSCNLSCPSCRETKIMEKNSDKINKQIALFDELSQWALDHPDKYLIVNPIMNGEVFASHSGLKFLESVKNFPGHNLKLDIHTNGTLLNRNRETLVAIRHMISNLWISIDAATPETYAQVRGGDWQELMQGLELVKELRIEPHLRYCIQKTNWHEIEQFADLAHKFNATVGYQKLLDWGHWNIKWWHDNNVVDRKRPEFEAVLQAIQTVKQRYTDRVSFTADLQKYLDKMIQKVC